MTITLKSLRPTGGDLWFAAWFAMSGDPAMRSVGSHGGRNPDAKDVIGHTKRLWYRHAAVKDMLFFDKAARSIGAGWTLPPSRRSWVPKEADDPGRGQRPIDVPSELKRAVAVHARRKVEQLLEGRLTRGQFGARQAEFVPQACQRPGATVQDHMVTAMHRRMQQGHVHVVAVDLADAFGQVPHKALRRALQGAGIDKAAANWLIRIAAIDTYDRNHHVNKVGTGIEQGNPLSALLLNTVLAPLFRAVETRFAVDVYAYVDDIYLLAKTEDEAWGAFAFLADEAKKQDFQNVRKMDGGPKATTPDP